MRILVTGASGFVGRAIAQHLVVQNHDIVGLVHRSTAPTCVSKVIPINLGIDGTVESLLQACEPVHAIVHTAAYINYQCLHQDVVRVNCLGLQQILDVALQWGVHTFINFSSIGVLGLPVQHPITEQHSTSPRTTYHASKLFSETLTSLAATPQMSTASLRLTSPVGAGMPDGRIFSVFVRQALRNGSLTLSGKGQRKQNYIDLRDVTQAISLCLKHRPTGTFNLGGPREISNLDLAQACIRVLESKSTIEFTGKPDPAEEEVWDVSCEAAKSAFNYEPTYDIESSIRSVAMHPT